MTTATQKPTKEYIASQQDVCVGRLPAYIDDRAPLAFGCHRGNSRGACVLGPLATRERSWKALQAALGRHGVKVYQYFFEDVGGVRYYDCGISPDGRVTLSLANVTHPGFFAFRQFEDATIYAELVAATAADKEASRPIVDAWHTA